ncbi:MAG: TIGR03857 family LLM class F420-dependent oxidoreductase [Solirubrobacteraceae bacterium]
MTNLSPLEQNALAPVVPDISIWLIPGRVTDPSLAIPHAIDAERLGFRRVFLSERFDLKDAGALLGGVLARTSRLEAGTGIMAAGARSPLMAASMAATLQAAYGHRFVFGLGRSSGPYLAGQGISEFTFQAFADYFDILRRLFRGETVSYDGPAGRYDALQTVDPCPGKPPELWATSMGGPVATKLAARIADGLILPGFLTSEAVARVAATVRAERERHGLDPDRFPILYYMIAATDLDETYTRAIAHARFVTYVVGMPTFANSYIRNNGWEEKQMRTLLEHPQFEAMRRPTADQAFHRAELLEASKRVPEEWIQETCAIGSLEQCVSKIREYREAGADEIGFYGSTPMENAALIDAWRDASVPTAV